MKTKPTPRIVDLLAKAAPMTDEQREEQAASLTRGLRSGGRTWGRCQVFIGGVLIGEGECCFETTKGTAP